jgi:hypothetical protein
MTLMKFKLMSHTHNSLQTLMSDDISVLLQVIKNERIKVDQILPNRWRQELNHRNILTKWAITETAEDPYQQKKYPK